LSLKITDDRIEVVYQGTETENLIQDVTGLFTGDKRLSVKEALTEVGKGIWSR
jgi:hypothetical protein